MTLEKYFQTGFWKDHLARYQKRPIYWLFQSNKKNPAFQVLVYMHRMDAYSCEKVRTYLLSYIDYLKQRINQLEQNESTLSPAETRKLIKMKDNLKECLSYEERLHHVANQQIAFDLDDGVKVNYAKFGDVLAAIS
jgi:type II restriction/modification system DNA methylase subunit YeeA